MDTGNKEILWVARAFGSAADSFFGSVDVNDNATMSTRAPFAGRVSGECQRYCAIDHNGE